MYYEKINLTLGSTIEEAVELLLHNRSQGKLVSVKFNDKTLYSDTVTMDDAYLQIVGKLKFRLEVHKMKCVDCDIIFLVEKPRNIPSTFVCPTCAFNLGVQEMGVITVVEE